MNLALIPTHELVHWFPLLVIYLGFIAVGLVALAVNAGLERRFPSLRKRGDKREEEKTHE